MEVRHGAQHGQLLDGLMGRSVLSHADAVMGKYIGKGHAHKSGQPCHWLCIIAEHKEGGHECPQAAVKHETISNSGHGQLADTEMQVASGIVILGEIAHVSHVGLGGRSQVCRSSNQVRHQVLKLLKLLAGQAPGSIRLVLKCPVVFTVINIISQIRIIEFIP